MLDNSDMHGHDLDILDILDIFGHWTYLDNFGQLTYILTLTLTPTMLLFLFLFYPYSYSHTRKLASTV